MFCPKCGKEIPEETKFCNHCGAEQGGGNSVKQQEKSPGGKNKINPIILSLIVVVVMGLFGRFVIAPMMLTDGNSDGDTVQTTAPVQDPDGTPDETSDEPGKDDSSDSNTPVVNSDYAEIFSSRYIVESPALFFGLDSAAFASAYNTVNGETVEKLEFGYKNDVIKEMICTVYISVSDYSDEEKQALEEENKDLIAELDALDCCEVTSNMGNNFYIVTIHCTDIDNASNLQALVNEGFELADEGATYLSMSKTESELLADGYVKK